MGTENINQFGLGPDTGLAIEEGNNPGTVVLIADGTQDIVNSSGVIIFTNLPTADPHVVGHLWTNSHVLTVSAG